MGILRIVALAALLCFGAAGRVSASDTLLNRPAPPFSRADLSGVRISLSAYDGKVVLLNFWATWCAPCRIELPRFAAWQKQFAPEGLQVLAVSMDDDPAAVRSLLRKLRPDYPILMGDAKLGEMYGGILGLPVTFLIDRHGIIRARFESEADLSAMESQLRKLLSR